MDANNIAAFNLTINCIKTIQDFDGSDKNQLPDFISQVENILPTLSIFDGNSKKILFDFLKNKCIGLTRPVIHRYGNIESWVNLKQILLKHFGEKENSDELMDLLKLCRVETTIERYYDKINEITSRLHNRILTHTDETYTTDEVNRIALRVFRDNLPEPTKTMIFARNPSTLDDAYKIIEEARHQNYTIYGPITKMRNNKTNYRTNFSNNNRNTNEPLTQNDEPTMNATHQYQLRNNDNSNTNFRRQDRQDQPYHNSTNSSRVSANTRNTQRYNQNRTNTTEPMDIGHSNVNFQSDPQDNYPI